MAFSETEIESVWKKGQIDPNNNAIFFRKDSCGAFMRRTDYGNVDSEYGWEIDHIVPVSKGGSDALSNLRPLQWENNRAKGDGPLVCVVTA